MGRISRKRREGGAFDYALFVVTLALLVIGIVMVFSASSVRAYDYYRDAYYFLKRQLLWATIGICAMVVTANIDYRIWRKLAWPIFLLNLALLVVVLIPGIGISMRGSRRWLGAGGFTFQPSELMKLSIVIFMAALLSERRKHMREFVRGLLVPLLIGALIFGLIMLEPDLGTASTIVGVCIIMIFVAGASVGQMAAVSACGLPVFIAAMIAEPYRLRRLFAFVRPWDDPLGAGFHIIQSLLALGSGGILGVGLGRSRQKFLYLPEQHTDFIFAVIGEELGLVGTLTVVFLFLAFAWRGIRIALGTEDMFGSLVACGMTCVVMVQAVINMGVVTGSLPITGITLPLISFGGSSLVTTLASIGIILNISRYAKL